MQPSFGPMLRRLVLASGNAGKLRECRALLQPLDLDIISQAELAIEAAAEPHASFIENALAKARHAATLSRLPALADDSGLCCDALAGAPGVRSARFAADAGQMAAVGAAAGSAVGAPAETHAAADAIDRANNQWLLRQLHGRADRRAHYVCVLVALRAPDDPEPIVAQGRWYGQIIDERRGANGFGYDPHFYLPDLDCTAAQLTPEHKNRISHRGQAMQALLAQMQTQWRRS